MQIPRKHNVYSVIYCATLLNNIVENKKRERMQREEGENAERRGRETERRERREKLK